ncbi:MAG: hypothetical protein NTV01_08460 [Bacteroidia bacterium]|nr:hypothetical protein [Bacteroidia bacterium]
MWNKATLGIYGRLHGKPMMPEHPKDQLATPLISHFVIVGFTCLIQEDLASIEGGFIFPTPQLIEKVLEKWKKVIAQVGVTA